MLFFPNCKINIGLDIIEKRPDGYHEIETLMFPVRGLYDALEIIPDSGSDIIFSTSGLTIEGDPEKNLCIRAYQLMKKQYGIGGIRMHLHKVIPMGAGLGGGSSDGAFAIKGLNELFELDLDNDQMERLAAELGSDTSFFIRNRPALASGRGEILTPVGIKLSGYHLVILKPNISVSTPEAYAGIVPRRPPQRLATRLEESITEWRSCIENNFESSVFAQKPEISALKSILYERGAIYASLSGSGSAVYGLFKAGTTQKFDLPDVFEYQEDIQ